MEQRGPMTVRVMPLAAWSLVIVLALLWLIWWQGDRLIERVCGPREPAVAAGATGGQVETPPPPGATDTELAAAEGHTVSAELAAVETTWTTLLGSAPTPPADLPAEPDCERAEQQLQALCRYLDSQTTVGERVQAGNSCALLRQVAGDLAARPPSPSSELRTFGTMLANVFHVFRTLGRERTRLLRDVLQAEPSVREPAAQILYRWAISRPRCDPDAALDEQGLYAYSGFLLNTIGGQAYLRRRSTDVETLASYYALLILDRSIERGFNPQGLDPRPEIERNLQQLTAQPLLFREAYRERLGEMAARWEARGTP